MCPRRRYGGTRRIRDSRRTSFGQDPRTDRESRSALSAGLQIDDFEVARRSRSASVITRRWQPAGSASRQSSAVRGPCSSSPARSSSACGGVLLHVRPVGSGRLGDAAGVKQPAHVGGRAELAAVLVGDAVVAEQLAEPRLRHPGPARLRPEAHVDHALHARRLEFGDEFGREQLLVADGPDRGHGPQASDAAQAPRLRAPSAERSAVSLGGRTRPCRTAPRAAAATAAAGGVSPCPASRSSSPSSPRSSRPPPRAARARARCATGSAPARPRSARWRAPPRGSASSSARSRARSPCSRGGSRRRRPSSTPPTPSSRTRRAASSRRASA